MSKAATRERILRAALLTFAEKGYHGALVDDIVRASGTSKGAVYHHFPNKEALFLALVDDFAGRLADGVATAIERSHGALGKVEAALRAGLETFGRHRELARILLLEAVSQAVAEGSIPPLDTRVATLTWLGAVNELVIQWLATGEPDRLEGWVRAHADAAPEHRRRTPCRVTAAPRGAAPTPMWRSRLPRSPGGTARP